MMDAKTGVREATIEAVVIRANGDREELGVVSYWHKNPVRRILWRVFQWRP
jgi:hypothetical protein